MSRGIRYVLDTNILICLVRGGDLGNYIKDTYDLGSLKSMPIVSIVSHGEILSIAKYNKWESPKMRVIRDILDNAVTVGISDQEILDAYVEIDVFSRRLKSSVTMAKNDLWIAATALISDSILLSTDRDFGHLPVSLVKHEFIDPDRFSHSK